MTQAQQEWQLINRRLEMWWAKRRNVIRAEACPTCGRSSGLIHMPIDPPSTILGLEMDSAGIPKVAGDSTNKRITCDGSN